MGYFVYILQSEKDGRYYYGQTQNLTSRLEDHNSGKSGYTRKYLPWKIFAFRTCDSRAEAMKFEKMLKNLHHTSRIKEFVVQHHFTTIPT